LFVAGELLDRLTGAQPGQRVLEIALHEAAHALAFARGIKETSRNGRYHNRRFARLAEELGLVAPTTPSVIGWSECTLPDKTAVLYDEELAALEAAIPAWRVDRHERRRRPATPPAPDDAGDIALDEGQDADEEAAPVEPEPIRREGKRVSVSCQCSSPRRISVTLGQLDVGLILCGVCGSRFSPTGVSREVQDHAGDVEREPGRVDAVDGEELDLLVQAAKLVVETGRGSTSLVQRKVRVGFAHAVRLMSMLEEQGVVGPRVSPTKPRDVRVTPADLADLLASLRPGSGSVPPGG
jgi:hypothetical protein